MATFTTEQATKYFRGRLSDPRNPMPWLIIEQAHKTQNFKEIETRLQGKFGFHDHGPSLHLIARDAVCNLVLERGKKRAEQIENYKGWEVRRVAACQRINAGQYGYCDPQAEDDGISLAAIDAEMGQLQNEYRLTDDEVAAIECEVTPEDRRNGSARVELARAALNVIQPDPAHGFLARVKVKVKISATCEACEMEVSAGISRQTTERAFVEMLIKIGWTATKTGLRCEDCPPLNVVTCQKCGGDTTGPLIAVDAEDFDVRIFTEDGWVADPNKKVKRLICGKCCRG